MGAAAPRRVAAATAIVAAALLAPSPAEAAAAELVGATLTLGGKRVPLPNAAWALLAERSSEILSPPPARAATLDSVVVGASQADALRYLVVVRANRAPADGVFGLAGACRRTDLHSAHMLSRDGSTVAACSFVTHVMHGATADADPAWIDALAAIASAGRAAPRVWLVVGLRIADTDDLLDVRYYFNPEAIGFAPASAPDMPSGGGTAWAGSEWSVPAVAREPRRAAVMRDLLDWAAAAHSPVYAGFKGRPGQGLPTPAFWSGRPAEATTVGEGRPIGMALWKTATWRAVASSLDVVIGFAFTGSAMVAGGITVASGVAGTVSYYLHEKVWEAFGFPRGPGDRITELRPAGIER